MGHAQGENDNGTRFDWVVRYRTVFQLFVLALPFTQAPTVKLGIRFVLVDWLALFLLALLIPYYLTEDLTYVEQVVLLTVVVWFGYSTVVTVFGASLVLPDLMRTSSYISDRVYSLGVPPIAKGGLETVRLLQMMAALMSTVFFCRERSQLLEAVRLLSYAGTVSAAYALYLVGRSVLRVPLPILPGTYQRGHEYYWRAVGTFWEPNGYSVFAALTVVLTLFLISRYGAERRWKVFLPVQLSALILTLSTTAFGALGVGTATLLLMHTYYKHVESLLRYAMAIAVVILCGAAILIVSPEAQAVFTNQIVQDISGTSGSAETRISSIVYILTLLESLLLTGIGNGIVWYTGSTSTQYVVIVSESGIIGLGSFVTLILFALWGVLSIDDEHLSVYLMSGLATVLSGITFYITYRMSYIWFLLGLCIAAGIGFGNLESQFQNAVRGSLFRDVLPGWRGSLFRTSKVSGPTFRAFRDSTLYRWPVDDITPDTEVADLTELPYWDAVRRTGHTFAAAGRHSVWVSTLRKIYVAREHRTLFTRRVTYVLITAGSRSILRAFRSVYLELSTRVLRAWDNSTARQYLQTVRP